MCCASWGSTRKRTPSTRADGPRSASLPGSSRPSSRGGNRAGADAARGHSTATVSPCFYGCRADPIATDCHRLQPRGSIKAHLCCPHWLRNGRRASASARSVNSKVGRLGAKERHVNNIGASVTTLSRMRGGVDAISEAATGRRAQHRADAPTLGANPSGGVVARTAATGLPRNVRAHPEPLALQVLQRAVQGPLRGGAPLGRLFAVGKESERLRPLN